MKSKRKEPMSEKHSETAETAIQNIFGRDAHALDLP